MSIKAIDKTSIHRITSGQVVIDLQTAVKELVENSLDAGATNLEVRFKQYGLATIEVIDNGGGISEENYEGLALKNHTSKLSSFADLTTVTTFGFRGEALSSLCALCESVVVSTATQPPMGVTLELESSGKIRHKGKVARQRGTAITLTNLFSTLPVRRKEFERNAKREFGKALTLLNAYALGPCSSRNGVRLTVSNQAEKGQKSVQIRTPGTPSLRESVSALWGPKALDDVVDLDLSFLVERDKVALKRATDSENRPIQAVVRGLISKFAVACGRTGTDRQFFYINGRPCNLSKIQKAFNEVYRSFNATQSPFIIADLILPTDSCDINVSPDKRSILLHHEANLISAFKTTLESSFASSRSTYDVEATQPKTPKQTTLAGTQSSKKHLSIALVAESDERADSSNVVAKTRNILSATQSSSKRSSMALAVNSDDSSDVTADTPIVLPVTQSSNKLLSTALVVESEEEDDFSDGAAKTQTVLSATQSSNKRSPVPFVGEPDEADEPLDMTATVQGTDIEMEPIVRPIANPTTHTNPTRTEVPPSQSTSRFANTTCFETAAQQQQGDSPFLVPEPAVPAKEERISGTSSVAERDSSPSNLPSEDVLVTLDSSSLSWHRKLQLTRKLQDDAESPPVPSSDGHARKKRRSEPDGSPRAEPDAPVHPRRPTGTKSARQNLRTMLAGFSSAGSQRAPEAKVDEDELESSDDEGERFGSPSMHSSTNLEEDGDTQMQVDSDTLDVIPTGTADSRIDVSATPADEKDDEDEIMIIQHDSSAPDLKPPAALANSSGIDLTDDMFDSSELSTVSLDISARPSSNEVVSRPEVIRVSDDSSGDVSLRFDVSKISDSWRSLRQSLATASSRRQPDDASLKVPLDAGLTNASSDEVATDALARSIDKEDFGSMEIVGQFNLGFIITRRRKGDDATAMDDLFIVDQHAADEKYNFETLQQTTRIKSQKLFRSQPLELTASDELLTLENLDVLRQNGFEIELQTAADDDAGQSPRLSLTAQPISKDTVFDMKDLEELIHLMHDQPAGQMVRCSKARAMFAMRACRKSVMIGMPLTKGQMTAVVRHMGTMDQPWNCPHGRPTMRHLSDILGVQDARRVDWSGFEMI